jgi:hypothetical protein
MNRRRFGPLNRTRVQPAWSLVTIDHTAQCFRLTLPAVGLGRHRKEVPWVPAQSLFWVGGILCFVAAILTVFFLALPHLATHNAAGGKPVVYGPNELVVPWPVWAGLAGFWGVCVAGILGSLNLCRCHGIVEVTDGVLRVRQSSLFGCRQQEWPHDQVAAVQTGPSGFTVGGGTHANYHTVPGGIPVAELHLYLKDGRRVRLFAGRSADELDWIAMELRQALQIGQTKNSGL